MPASNLIDKFPVALTARDLSTYDLYLAREDKGVDGRMNVEVLFNSLALTLPNAAVVSGTDIAFLSQAGLATQATMPALAAFVAANGITLAGVAGALTGTAPTQAAGTQAGVGWVITASNATAGASVAGAQAGGDINIISGNAARLTSGNAQGGYLNLTAGSGIGTEEGGRVVLTGGDGGATGGGEEGAILQVRGGTSTAGGLIQLQGQTSATGGVGATVTINGGLTSGTGGGVDVAAGAGVGTNKTGGSITLTPGAKTGSGADGKVIVRQPGGTPGTDDVNLYVESGFAHELVIDAQGGPGSAQSVAVRYQGTLISRFVNSGDYTGLFIPDGSGAAAVIFGDDAFTADAGVKRVAARVVKPTAGNTGDGWFQNTAGRDRVNAAAVTATDTTMVNVIALSKTVIAGRKYIGKYTFFANNSTGADGLKFDMGGGTATFTSIEFGFSAALGATLGTVASTTSTTAITVTVVSTSDAVYEVSFGFVCNAAGTVIPRFAEVVDGGGTATVQIQSFVLMEDSPT